MEKTKAKFLSMRNSRAKSQSATHLPNVQGNVHSASGTMSRSSTISPRSASSRKGDTPKRKLHRTVTRGDSSKEVSSKDANDNKKQSKKPADTSLPGGTSSGPQSRKSASKDDNSVSRDARKSGDIDKRRRSGSLNDHSVAHRSREFDALPATPEGDSLTLDSAIMEDLVLFQVKVLYPFEAEGPNEIDCAEGEIVDVIFDVMKSEGWYEVLKGTRRGLVPVSFVEVLPETVRSQDVPTNADIDLESGSTKLSTAANGTSGAGDGGVGGNEGGGGSNGGGSEADAPHIESEPIKPESTGMWELQTAGAVPYFQPKNTISENDSPRTRRRKKRCHVIEEILVTERAYVRDLRHVCNNYLAPMKKLAILPPNEVQIIFRNVDTIFQLHEEVLRSLEAAKGEGDVVWNVEIGPVFIELSSYLKVYTTYCVGHERSRALVQKRLKDHDAFLQFHEELLRNEQSRGLDLLTLMMAPVQRICKYPLLFKELIKETDESSPDYVLLNRAVAELMKVADHVNEQKRMAFSISRLAALDKRMTNLPDGFSLAIPTRKFLMEGDLLRIANGQRHMRRFFLFNDVLIYAKTKWNDKYQFLGCVMLDKELTFVEEVPEDVAPNAFQIIKMDGTNNIFSAADEEEKEMWLKELGALVGGVKTIEGGSSLYSDILDSIIAGGNSDSSGDDSDEGGSGGAGGDADARKLENMQRTLGLSTSTGEMAAFASGGEFAHMPDEYERPTSERKMEVLAALSGGAATLHKMLNDSDARLLLEGTFILAERKKRIARQCFLFYSDGDTPAAALVVAAQKKRSLEYKGHLFLNEHTRAKALLNDPHYPWGIEVIANGAGVGTEVLGGHNLRQIVLLASNEQSRNVWVGEVARVRRQTRKK